MPQLPIAQVSAHDFRTVLDGDLTAGAGVAGLHAPPSDGSQVAPVRESKHIYYFTGHTVPEQFCSASPTYLTASPTGADSKSQIGVGSGHS
jgi:hypothetical protein